MEYGKISTKQQEILDYIKTEIINRGYPPTVRDICNAVNLKSTSSVHSHLATLEREGYIIRDKTKPRAIEIVDDSFNASRCEIINVPIVGRVAAGEPILAIQNIEDYFPIPAEFLHNKTTFMLKVKGESMINVGILDGDIVIVQKQKTANNGDIVVAMTEENEVTLKRFFKEEDHIRLQPENDQMDPIILPTCTILGKAIGLYRKF